jgi:hypothetical protein
MRSKDGVAARKQMRKPVVVKEVSVCDKEMENGFVMDGSASELGPPLLTTLHGSHGLPVTRPSFRPFSAAFKASRAGSPDGGNW